VLRMEPEGTGSTTPVLGARGLARHAAWSYLALSATLVSGFLNMAVAFREVPNRLIGVYAIAHASTALLAIIDPAIAYGVTRSTARLRANQSVTEELRFVHSAHSVLVALGFVATAAAATLGLVAWSTGAVSLPGRAWLMIALLSSALLVQLLTAVLPAAAAGMQDFRANAIASALLGATSLLVVISTIDTAGVAALGLGQLAGMALSRTYLVKWARRRVPWLRLRPERPQREALGGLLRFSGPMLVVAIAAQIVAWTDVVSIGALVGASASALYRAGTLPPTQGASMLWRAYDVVYPVLSRSSEQDQERATSLLLRVFSAVAGVGFAALIVLRRDVISIVTGAESNLAQDVLVVFCLVWAINMPAHGLSLLAISRGQHGVYIPVVIGEAVGNLLLTLALVPVVGARGAAVATLITLLISNVAAVPFVLRRAIPTAPRLVASDGLVPLATTGLVAFSILTLENSVEPTVLRLVIQGATTLALAGAAAALSGGRAGRRALRSSLSPEDTSW
jgi:O-antigen/teichoic acid export membrane protein